jgi:hypothetical protein
MIHEFRIQCSEDQLDIIEDFLVSGGELGMQPDERAWIIAHAKKKYPTGKVIGADLDVVEGEWAVKVEVQ